MNSSLPKEKLSYFSCSFLPDMQVFESNHSDNNLVGSIQGPCLVLPPLQYRQEIERRAKEGSKEDIVPLFLCQ